MLPRLAVTLGEPAGIGPELLVRLAQAPRAADLVAVGDRGLLAATAARLGLPLQLVPFDASAPRHPNRPPERLQCLHLPLPDPVRPGCLDPGNARAVLATLDAAADGCVDGRFDGVVTLPMHKGVINEAGVAFSGHTEYFAERCGGPVLMLLVAEDRDLGPGRALRVALATTHLPLADVSAALTVDRLVASLTLLDTGLRQDFGLAAPRIAALGLNPHAGEGGHLGSEEIQVIAPALAQARAAGLRVDGPLAADTAFVRDRRGDYDAYFAMFHDQGLPVLKAIGFGSAVNVTLGLPFVRTSVDHGVALDIAGIGCADPASAIAAIGLAIELAGRRSR